MCYTILKQLGPWLTLHSICNSFHVLMKPDNFQRIPSSPGTLCYHWVLPSPLSSFILVACLWPMAPEVWVSWRTASMWNAEGSRSREPRKKSILSDSAKSDNQSSWNQMCKTQHWAQISVAGAQAHIRPSITGIIIESLKPGVLVLVCSMHINCNRRDRSEHPSWQGKRSIGTEKILNMNAFIQNMCLCVCMYSCMHMCV